MRQLYKRQNPRSASLVLCLLSVLTCEQLAWCQSTESSAERGDPADCLNDQKCSELYESARRLSQAGQYEAALVTYQSAYAQKPTPWLLVNIGRMQQKAGRPQQAVRTFKRFLDDPAAKEDAELQTKAQEYLQQAESEVRAQEQPREVTLPPTHKVEPSTKKVATPINMEKAPIYKKWWFWTAVGGATTAVVVGLAVGLANRPTAVASNPPDVPQGVSVYDTGF